VLTALCQNCPACEKFGYDKLHLAGKDEKRLLLLTSYRMPTRPKLLDRKNNNDQLLQ
jgi:hypothetical protein